MEQHTQNTGNPAGAFKGQDVPEALSTGEFPVQPAGKLTPREKRWIMYDVGNSAFVLLSTAVVPIYANSLLEAAGQDNIVSTWGYAQTVASLVIALLMPILGSIADVQGMKIKFFLGFFLTGVVMCLGMSLPLGWLAFLIVYVLATIGLNGSLTFYDSMLIDTTSNERMDKVSSHGYAWGYVGSTIPFIVCIAVIFGGPSLLGLDTATCTRISFLITAVWWVAFTVPLLRSYRQVHYRTTADHTAEAVRGTFRELAATFRRIAHDRSLLLFMIAFFFYIDAVNTVISMSTSYGTQLGIDSTQLVIALLVTQFVAFPCAILYGRLAGRFGAKRIRDRGDRLSGYCDVRRILPENGCGVLDSGDSGGHVPGRHPGALTLVLRQNHSEGPRQRVLRLLRHLRQDRLGAGHVPGGHDHGRDGQRVGRRAVDRGAAGGGARAAARAEGSDGEITNSGAHYCRFDDLTRLFPRS